MAGKHLSEDEIRYVVSADASKLMQEYHKMNKSTNELRSHQKELRKEMVALEAAGKKGSKEYMQLAAASRELGKQISANEAEMKKMRSQMDVNVMTMNQLKKLSKSLTAELNNMSQASHPEEYKKLERRLGEVNNKMKQLKRSSAEAANSLEGGTDGIFGKIKSMFSSASMGWTKFLGMATAAVAGVTTAIEGVKWFYNFNKDAEEAMRLTREFTGLAGDSLTSVSARIQAISQTYGKDQKDVLGAVDALMSQYGIDAEKAMSVVEDGFSSGADLGGDMLDMIGKYGPAFNDMGVDAAGLVSVIAQTRSGIFSKGGMDLITMAGKRIREMSGETSKSLDAIGINSKQMQKDLESGSKSMFQVIQEISGKLKNMPQDSQAVGNVLKDVFGRQGVQGGLKMIESLATMSTKIEDVKAVTGEYGKLQQEQVDTQAELNEKMMKFFGLGGQGFDELIMKGKVFGMKILISIIDFTAKIINYFIDLYNQSILFRGSIQNIIVQFKSLWEVVKLVFNIVIDSFKGIGRMAKALAQILEGVVTLDVSKIKQGATALVDNYKKSFSEITSDAKKFGKNVANNFVDSFNKTVKGQKVERISLDMKKNKETPGNEEPKNKNKDKKGKGGNGDGNHHNAGGGHGKNAVADESDSLFRKQRQQDLDEAKKGYQDDLNALKEALAKKKLTQEQYNAYVTSLNIEHQNNLLNIEKSYEEAAEKLIMKDGKKKQELQEQQRKAVEQQQQAANDAYINAEKQFHDALEKIEKMGARPQTLEEMHQQKLAALDAYYKASLQQAVDDGEKQKQLTEAYEAAKAQIITEYTQKSEDEKAQIRQRYGLNTMEDQLNQEKAMLMKFYTDGKMSKEDYERAKENIEQSAEEHRLQIRAQYGIATQKELYEADLEQLRMHLQNKEITEEEYEEAVGQMKMDHWKQQFDMYSSMFGNAAQSLQQAEEASVDARYDAEIESAKAAGQDTKALEEKKQNEKLKIQKKYADVNFAIKASQIIADTSVSIMKAFSDLGPIAGAIAATLMGVTGAAQLAAANAERQKVKRMSLHGGATASQGGARVATGRESGGSIDVERAQDGKRFHARYDPTMRGFVDKPTVIVGEGPAGHSKEWVASNAAVENPTIAPILDIIDQAQKAGTIRTLDMRKWFVQQSPGRESGGYISPTPSLPTGDVRTTDKDPLMEKMYALLDKLSRDGIPAAVALSEIEQKQELLEQSRKFGKKR